jgi:hypothetical protein
VPKSLPSSLIVDQKTQQQMSQAHYMLGRLDEAAERLSDRRVLVSPTQSQEIQSMLALRGVTVATKEIAYVGLPGKPPPELKPEDRIVRYIESVDRATRGVERTSVGQALLRTATRFAQLSDGPVSDDELPWRTADHWFGDTPERAYHHAVPPGDGLHVCAEELLAWMDDPMEMPLIGKVSLGSYLLYTLAPFTHTSDLLHVYVALELIKAGALRDQIVATSVHIDRHRARFQRIHQRTVETGDFNEWVRFFSAGVIEQCGNQLNLIDQLGQLRDKNLAQVSDWRRDGFARFVSNLASFQVINATLAAERCKITVKYARELLHRAEGLGMVEEISRRKRNKVYEVKEVRRLVDRFAGMVPAADRAVHDT